LRLFIKYILKGSLILGFLFLFSSSYSQERFNVRYDSDFPNTIFASVIEVDSGYLCTGFLGDTFGFGGSPTIYAKFDYDGVPVLQKTYGGEIEIENRIISSQNPDLQFLNDSTLIHSGVTYDADGVRQGYVMKVNLEGDTLAMNRFHSPNYPGEDIGSIYNSITTLACKIAADGNVLVSSGYNNPGGTQTDIIIQKHTPEGELLWTYEHISDQAYEYVTALVPTEDGGGVFVVNDIIEFGVSGRSHFFRLDTSGDLEIEFYTPFENNTTSVADSFLEEEYLICTTQRKQFESPNYWTPQIMKIDTIGNIAWRTDLFPGEFSNRFSHNRIVKALDSSYVSGGTYGTDFANELETGSGFLSKVSSEGELIWSRQYTYVDLENDIHKLNDLKATSDGGYVFCGESNIINNDTLDLPGPQQQGWIVKVDEYGCLVEGCEIYDYVEEIGDIHTEEYIKIGPIPAQDVLNVYQIKKLPPDAFIEIIDMNGKQVKSFHIETQGTTLIVDISFLPAGQYLINLIDRGLVLQSERVLFY